MSTSTSVSLGGIHLLLLLSLSDADSFQNTGLSTDREKVTADLLELIEGLRGSLAWQDLGLALAVVASVQRIDRELLLVSLWFCSK